MKPGDRVITKATRRTGTIKRIVEGDEWPLPFAWVELDDDDYADFELRMLELLPEGDPHE